jgi:hypothetical protein
MRKICQSTECRWTERRRRSEEAAERYEKSTLGKPGTI